MMQKYSYPWFIQQFEKSKEDTEKFVLSVDETRFLQSPAKGSWSMAECYSHLINYGDLYYDNMATSITNTQTTTDNLEQAFQPRWIFRKLESFFEPPYQIKLNTIDAMKPDPVTGYNRMELLDQYINLQDRFIALLEKAQHQHLDLGAVKVKHPVVSVIRMTLSECFALAEVHQRRHQWQAQQTLKKLRSSTPPNS